jgi:phosphoenolpyruvate carboxylase
MPRLNDPRVVVRVLRAYTLLFQLINTAEQKEIVRVNRERQARAGDAPRTESIAEAIPTLRRAGASAEHMQAVIDRLDACPTLTAHPTEARRRSVLDKLQSIAAGLVERSIPLDTPKHRMNRGWFKIARSQEHRHANARQSPSRGIE